MKSMAAMKGKRVSVAAGAAVLADQLRPDGGDLGAVGRRKVEVK